MPLIKKIATDNNTRVGVWQVNEPIQFFEAGLHVSTIAEAEKIKAEKKRLEFLSSRHLLGDLLGRAYQLQKDQHGKPEIVNVKGSISLSHCNGYAAAILSDQQSVGIDIEVIHPRIRKIQHKFLNERELNALRPNTDVEQLILYWSAKEAIYKAYGKKQVRFAEDIWLEPIIPKDSGNIEVVFKKPGAERDFQLHYERIGEAFLTYVLG